MGCHALGEDVDDDDGKIVEAALKDNALAAYLLMCLSRPRSRAPSPPPSTSTAGAEDAGHLPDRPNWGTTRKRRARRVAAKEEDARRPSPATPLSWSGGSSTSGSVSESACPPNRHPDGAPGHGAEQGSRLPVPATPPSENRVLAVAAEMAAVGSSVSSGSNKAAEVRGPPRAAARIEPLRLGPTGDAAKTAGARRPAKKKTLPELKALTESLLQEQLQLKKELEARRNLFAALLEENGRLKSLEQSMWQAPPARSAAWEAAGSEPAAEEDRADPPKRSRNALLDLNFPPPADHLLLRS